MKRNLNTPLSTVLILVLLASCQLPLTATKASLKLQLSPPSSGRSLLADWIPQIDHFEYLLDNGVDAPFTGQTVDNSMTITIADLPAGDYSITVDAMNAGGDVVLSGTASQTLPSGTVVGVSLAPSQSATGGYSYRVRFPSDITKVTADLLLPDLSDGPGNLVVTTSFTPIDGSTNETTFSSTVTSGTYLLVVTYYRWSTALGAEVVVRRSPPLAVNVWDNAVSSRIVNFNRDDVFDLVEETDVASTNATPTDLVLEIDGSEPPVLDFSSGTTVYSTFFGPSDAALDFTGTTSLTGQAITYVLDGGAPQEVTPGVKTQISADLLGSAHTLDVSVRAPDGQSVLTYQYVLTRRATVNLSFTMKGFETLAFGSSALAFDEASSLVVTPGSPALQAGGTAWEWKVDGVPIASAAGLATFTFLPGDPVQSGDDRELTLGLHTLSVGVTYDGVRYSGAIPITVNALEAF